VVEAKAKREDLLAYELPPGVIARFPAATTGDRRRHRNIGLTSGGDGKEIVPLAASFIATFAAVCPGHPLTGQWSSRRAGSGFTCSAAMRRIGVRDAGIEAGRRDQPGKGGSHGGFLVGKFGLKPCPVEDLGDLLRRPVCWSGWTSRAATDPGGTARAVLNAHSPRTRRNNHRRPRRRRRKLRPRNRATVGRLENGGLVQANRRTAIHFRDDGLPVYGRWITLRGANNADPPGA
jgi:hypothetical protein